MDKESKEIPVVRQSTLQNKMKKLVYACLMAVLAAACTNVPSGEIEISRDALQDKIKGGWAGQCIGVTYGRAFEFRYASPINKDIPVKWNDDIYVNCFPGFDDDLYMDITFVDVYERQGLDAPVDSLAMAFANARYSLWHANQAARYNILNGIMPPYSGDGKHSCHADDIDFQIESDHCGLMSPGMPNAAIHYAQNVGHIMNSGDGFYSGVYFSVMYSLAFISSDIYWITSEALKAIPQESKYYQAMSDIISFHKQYPDTWDIAWALLQKKYGNDVACPDGAMSSGNIDALINSGYVLIGLLYGEGDFEKTMDIAMRCGQDTDCNASSSAGIIGTVLGYNAIPEKYRKPLEKGADLNFDFTDYSFDKSWKVSLSQALKVIEKEGGEVNEESVKITYKEPAVLPLEQNFIGLKPYEKTWLRQSLTNNQKVEFEGSGISVKYYITKDGVPNQWSETSGYVALVEVWLDGALQKTVRLPESYHDRTDELYFNFDIPFGKHTLEFKYLNPEGNRDIFADSIVLYK